MTRVTTELCAAEQERQKAVEQAQELLGAVPPPVLTPPPGIDTRELAHLWSSWESIRDHGEDLTLLDALDRMLPTVCAAIGAVRRSSANRLAHLDEEWRPIVTELTTWHTDAVVSEAEKPLLKQLKEAETWLKATSTDLRDSRFAPIAARSAAVWQSLRQGSEVDLGAVRLEGAGNFRKMVLDVTVDGAEASVLGASLTNLPQ